MEIRTFDGRIIEINYIGSQLQMAAKAEAKGDFETREKHLCLAIAAETHDKIERAEREAFRESVRRSREDRKMFEKMFKTEAT
jgi:hypothetical protein